jgi:hypothetical protein
MHDHAPQSLQGPIRGSSTWWRGLEPENAPAGNAPEPAPPIDKDNGIRKELVARVRKDIAAGIYDTPDKWEAALDRLLERLGE